jgi:hypothetical protein
MNSWLPEEMKLEGHEQIPLHVLQQSSFFTDPVPSQPLVLTDSRAHKTSHAGLRGWESMESIGTLINSLLRA